MQTNLPVNLSPKARFMLGSENISRHKSMVDSDHFTLAADAALLQVQSLWVQQITEPNTAMAVGLKLQGAMEFLQTLKLLAETPRLTNPPLVSDNLKSTR